MKTTKNLFSERDCLLVLGEGNFSFTLNLSTEYKCKIIATDVTTDCPTDHLTRHNCQQLINNGHEVYFGIDATKLEEYSDLKSNQNINYIVFNFPHVLTKKMKIGLNRDLLKKFFESASNFIGERKGVKVLVSLCSGQSGINTVEATDKQREWSDSWQLTEMAANGHFVITDCNDFSFDYRLFGYRLKNTEFNSSYGKTFTLEKRQPFDITSHKLSLILDNNQNLFSNHLIISLIEELKTKIYDSAKLEVKIDFKTKLFPFITHCFVLKRQTNTFSKLNEYFGNRLTIADQNLVSNGITIGQICDTCIRLNVEQLAHLKYGISDSRILWSEYLRFDNEDKQYTTGSLFFRQHIHDISFWVNSDQYYSQLLQTILDIFGTLLKSIELIDSFVLDNKTSKCYRIVYESVDRGLSQQKCNQMQNTVRDLLKQRYGLALR